MKLGNETARFMAGDIEVVMHKAPKGVGGGGGSDDRRGVTRELYDALKQENHKLQSELAEARGKLELLANDIYEGKCSLSEVWRRIYAIRGIIVTLTNTDKPEGQI